MKYAISVDSPDSKPCCIDGSRSDPGRCFSEKHWKKYTERGAKSYMGKLSKKYPNRRFRLIPLPNE